MSWASRRRTSYIAGIILFFVISIGVPVFYSLYSSVPPACVQGTMRPPGQTGGPCSLIDPSYLQPSAALWARSFKVRDGTYTAVASINNPNRDVGVADVHYTFKLYDDQNILVTERDGDTYLMPGAVTPILESRIDTGNRVVAHTYFQFTEPLVWQRMRDIAPSLAIGNQALSNTQAAPQLSATVQNTSVEDAISPQFVAVIYDAGGNAFAASETGLGRLNAGASATITFSWPSAFAVQPARIDITPLFQPVAVPVSQ